MTRPEIVEESIPVRSEGLRLDAVLAYPGAGEPEASVLLLAPHPHMGGRMENNLIRHLARRAAEEGCASLRFDYRGVGESEIELPEGTSLYAHWSEMEKEQRYELLLPDARAAWHTLDRIARTPRRVLVGYSLGAILGGMLAPEVDATHLVAVSPPVSRVSLRAYRESRVPVLFVGGDTDFAFDLERFEAEYERLPGPKAFHLLEGSDHFYRQEEERVYACIAPLLCTSHTDALTPR